MDAIGVLKRLDSGEWLLDRSGYEGLAGLLTPNKMNDKRKGYRVSLATMNALYSDKLIVWSMRDETWEITEAGREYVTAVNRKRVL